MDKKFTLHMIGSHIDPVVVEVERRSRTTLHLSLPLIGLKNIKNSFYCIQCLSISGWKRPIGAFEKIKEKVKKRWCIVEDGG